MPMTTGQRTLTVLSAGLLFLSSPVQASLEKIKILPHAQSASQVTALKHRVITHKNRMFASWYGEKFQGRITASGEMFDLNELTAAHRTLPLGSMVKLRVRSTGRSVVVRINDRGPWVKGRDFDLSEAAAIELGIYEHGIAAVEATVIHHGVALAGAARR